ncbi:hypothetical protein TW79_21245 [Tritonibacter mobilis]|uniref:Uncharacterized protein n=1 Tax=Tritonibacter mobilis F1926 TaxID=1265309 RepID=A0A1B1A533_9RHOB|nr:hypothetical protein K529_013015 [Tritonibacter mobilis F1926]KJZ21740.1 hypothetical protein TW79_21245 [Tritonibacter mobilis]
MAMYSPSRLSQKNRGRRVFLEFIKFIDKTNYWIDCYATWSIIATFTLALILLYVAKFQFSDIGKIYADFFWVLFGVSSLILISLSLTYSKYPQIMERDANLAYSTLMEVKRDAVEFNKDWCLPNGFSKDHGQLDAMQLSKFCKIVSDLVIEVHDIETSFYITIPFDVSPDEGDHWVLKNYNQKPKWEDIKMLKYRREFDERIGTSYSSSSIEERNIVRKLMVYINGNHAEYNARVQSIRDAIGPYRMFVMFEFFRMIILHVAAIAAAFRLYRPLWELRQKKRNLNKWRPHPHDPV